MSDLPDQLSVERHRDLAGRALHPWVKRCLIAGCSALVAGSASSSSSTDVSSRPSDVRFAVLETNGQVSFIPRERS